MLESLLRRVKRSQETVSIRLKAEAGGDVRNPAELAGLAGMTPDAEVLLQVGASGMVLISALDPRSLLDSFTSRIGQRLPAVNSDYRMSEGRAVRDYLSLPEAQRNGLWDEAFREAMDETARRPRKYAPTEWFGNGRFLGGNCLPFG